MLLPCDDPAAAVELPTRGQGSLVGSIVTHDVAVAREFVLGAAHAHGRVLVLDRDDPSESTGHGSPLPVLVHGGRAEPGEGRSSAGSVPSGTTRSAPPSRVRRTCSPRIGGRWVTGAARRDDGGHPFPTSPAELRIDDSINAGPRAITLADTEHVAEFTGDTLNADTDEAAAAANPLFGGRVAHSYLSLGGGIVRRPGAGARCSPSMGWRTCASSPRLGRVRS